jgi:hypothetical protein
MSGEEVEPVAAQDGWTCAPDRATTTTDAPTDRACQRGARYHILPWKHPWLTPSVKNIIHSSVAVGKSLGMAESTHDGFIWRKQVLPKLEC